MSKKTAEHIEEENLQSRLEKFAASKGIDTKNPVSPKQKKTPSNSQGPKPTQIDLWGKSVQTDQSIEDRQRGYTSEEIKSSALGIFSQLANEDNVALSEIPDAEADKHPTRYCRSGIFAASPASQLRKSLDESLHRHVDSEWGKYIISGLLTTDHEDVLMGIRHIQESKVRVTYDKTKHKLSQSWPLHLITSHPEIPLEEDIVFFTARELLLELGKGTGGSAYSTLSRIIRELDMATVTEIHQYEGPDKKTKIEASPDAEKIISIKKVEWEGQGLYMARFHPGFLQEITDKGTYSSWKIRKKLKKPIAKNIFKFMESQDTSEYWTMSLDKWDGVVGYYGRKEDRFNEYKMAAEDLVNNGAFEVIVILNLRSRSKKKPLSLDLFKSRELWENEKSEKRYKDSKYIVIENS